ncbi:MAG: hypothetical protein AB8D78_08675 [Akkermansiaceae bacterium]
MRDLLTPTAENLRAPKPGSVWRVACVAALGFAIYGFTVGFWRSPLMGVYVAAKMPLLIVLTLACNGLLNGLLGLLLGSGLNFRQSLHALLSAFAISSLILGSVAPVTFFLAVNVPSVESAQAATAHASYLLIHVFLIAVAGLVGVARLWKLLYSYSGSKRIAGATLGSWVVGNAFLGGQFSWVLRPFFGSPGLDVAFLRENPMQGSFYETVWRSIRQVSGGFTFEMLMISGGILAVLIFLFFQTMNQNRNHERTEPKH